MDYDGPPCGWDRFTEDTLVTELPCWLHGIVVSDDATAATIVYDGRNTSGRRMLSVRTVVAVTETVAVIFRQPLPVWNGLFVDVPAGVEDVLIAWRPMAEAPTPERAGTE